ncbi:MAG: nicotinate (nicotinamide) nucleotide adenylyltransferase [Phycisphaerae bacterium]|nr:nicotinate (nicotinamide) nucleotide adenylyltransferase [Phycisphaerae bacterium]
MKEKIILFGGTFDPIHNAHIQVANAAANEIGAQRVIFIPARRSPHKKNIPSADQSQRFEMISLAVEGYRNFEVSDCEFQRKEPSYTIDTVMHFKNLFGPQAKLYWLVGADAVGELCNWYRISELIDNCYLSFMPRTGGDRLDFTGLDEIIGIDRRKKLEKHTLNTPLIEISSTEIRQRIADSADLSMMLDPKIADYIVENGLYR